MDRQPGAVFHRRVSHKAEHGTRAGSFPVKPGLKIGCEGVGSFEALLAIEVASAWRFLGPAGSYGFGSLIVVALFGAVGPDRALIVGQRALGVPLEAFHRCLSLGERAIDIEVIIRQKRRDRPIDEARRHHLARRPGRQQPVAVLGEHHLHPNEVIEPETKELTEQ